MAPPLRLELTRDRFPMAHPTRDLIHREAVDPASPPALLAGHKAHDARAFPGLRLRGARRQRFSKDAASRYGRYAYRVVRTALAGAARGPARRPTS